MPDGKGDGDGDGDGDEEEDEDESVQKGRKRVSQAVLKDLGNKHTGDEMDIIAKTASHKYYLRSLEESQSYPSAGAPAATGGVALPAQFTAMCPYTIPKPRLPAPPMPKGTTATDYYEALDMRDQEIRKGLLCM